MRRLHTSWREARTVCEEKTDSISSKKNTDTARSHYKGDNS